MTSSIESIGAEATAEAAGCPHPQAAVRQTGSTDFSCVIQWCSECGAIRQLGTDSGWLAPRGSVEMVARHFEKLLVAESVRGAGHLYPLGAIVVMVREIAAKVGRADV